MIKEQKIANNETFAALTFIFFPLVVICERKENFNKAQSNQQNKTKRLLKASYAKPKITLSRLSILCCYKTVFTLKKKPQLYINSIYVKSVVTFEDHR